MKAKGAILTFAVILLIPQAQACSWAIGYFYQVTALRGRVVGTSWHAPRWLRQRCAKSRARLTLYDYRWPIEQRDAWIPVRTAETDDEGCFDFGPLNTGHYTLSIDDNVSFDVEVKEGLQKTEGVLIDVSPIYPDCTGGHEFVVRNQERK